jgi:hypothetical protein
MPALKVSTNKIIQIDEIITEKGIKSPFCYEFRGCFERNIFILIDEICSSSSVSLLSKTTTIYARFWSSLINGAFSKTYTFDA